MNSCAGQTGRERRRRGEEGRGGEEGQVGIEEEKIDPVKEGREGQRTERRIGPRRSTLATLHCTPASITETFGEKGERLTFHTPLDLLIW